ncbi:hypothetical protein [Vreelandella massiliensis]|uniref:hypothetical protein n=1 Tax=Vreelandella massiliensis TaxID=1816686 RepID=UPI00096A798D|nr:hypothetical protein [Halomonas massiliensis]
MFSLIITVMSISLVTLLAVASFYYGGDAYTDSAHQARINQVNNEAEQLAGAASLYRTTHLEPVTSIDNLVDTGFLTDWPEGGWGVGDGYIEMLADEGDTKVCHDMNEKATGSRTIPSCSDVDPGDSRMVCCTPATP